MRLSWNEIRARAAAFARKWKDAGYEKGETQTFYNEFFEIFGVRRESVARYEERVRRLDDSTGFIDLFWPGQLIVEQKSAGRDLRAAYEQAGGYFDALSEHERPRRILVCDFQSFELHDLLEREVDAFRLDELSNVVEKFGFILGVQKQPLDQDPASIEAARLLGGLRDTLEAAGYRRPDLDVFLVRLAFCLFADDTGVFEPRDLLMEFVEERTREDGSDLGPFLAHVFQVLDTPVEDRQNTLDEDLARFPHVNGDLFAGPIRIASFGREMREQLLAACRFDWSAVSPAIFGSLFQSVMDPEERRKLGAHYTTEDNILKVIQPLLLDDLWAELEHLKGLRRGKAQRLKTFQQRLGRLRFLDPACGCGNFLVIAYRELRRLEIEVIREMFEGDRDESGRIHFRGLDVSSLSLLDVDQFYGIEIESFPARIAEVALWMMDHLMNNELSREFGQVFARIPLERSPHIRCADALEMDWEELLPAKECSFVLGNPPFGGAKYQTKEKRAQVKRIAALGKSGGTLDYVTAWFLCAGEYLGQVEDPQERPRIGFVATNSITQGEQAGQLWPLLFRRHGLEIAFAHRTFAWGSEAPGMAHVHVVILGLDARKRIPKKRWLFSYEDPKGDPQKSGHRALSPYLFDAGRLSDPHLAVREESRPINGMPRLLTGSQPIDGGNTVFTSDQATSFLAEEPSSAPWLRPFVGAREYLHGAQRFILALHDVSPAVLRQMPRVRERLAAVRKFRSESSRQSTLDLAATPRLWQINRLPDAPFLVVPEVSSERREYVPIGWLEPPAIPSNLVRILENATLWQFALLTSAMHMAWLRHIGGRLESRYRYSIGLVYNTFPLPLKHADLSRLEPLAQVVLDARAAHPDATLADLYDPDLMPPNLHKAHRRLDRAVDRLYRRSGFRSEGQRIEHLFGLYEKLRAPLTAAGRRKKRRGRRR